ncbi:MAG: amino acid adenylation domain-containing protein [bacterium]|nr:amino acid adenylation domain-containing protein [bacterium]
MPKGVAVSHRQVLPILDWSRRYFPLDRSARVLQTLSPCFDFGVFELLTTLLGGGTLCFLPAAEHSDPDRNLDAVARHRLNTVHATPSFFRELLASGRPLSGLEVVHLGGEAIDRDLVRRIASAAGSGCRAYNGYGPTETSINSTIFRLRGRAWERSFRGTAVPIGRATARNSVEVLDRRGRPVPPGVAGELVIGGDGVARGYLDRPALSAERFVPDPFAEQPGRRRYRSGDLVRWLGDGHIEFLGRIDHQVKIRGLRLELGEIEAALGRHPAVREAVVRALAEPGREGGERWLVAYVVGAGEGTVPAASELRAWLGESLPAYMVPAAIVGLEALPRTATGKVDRRALPVPDRGALAAAGFTAPRDHGEQILAGIWAEVLGRERIGVHDDFFALGGHSLLATRVVSRVRRQLGIELAVRTLFERPTVAALAAAVTAARRRQEGLEAPPLRPAPRDALPLSFAQQRLWFLDRFEPGLALYNIPAAVALSGRLDPRALTAALSEIVRRHRVLCARYRTVDGEPIQEIAPARALPLPVAELSALPSPQRRAEADRQARREARQAFALERGPLLRTVLLRLGPEEHLLLVTVHHIAFDGWSLGVFLRELAALYQGSPPAPLPVQYADYAGWQRRWLTDEVLARQLDYWRRQLVGLPVLELPTDRPRPARQSFRGAVERVRLPAPLRSRLDQLSRQHGSTVFMTLLAAFQALVERHTGQRDFAVGSPVANRSLPALEGLVGLFVNTLVLRAELGGDPPFLRLLDRVRDTALGAYAHQDLPFERLVEELEPQRDLSQSPLAQVMFVLQNAPPAPPALGEGVAVRVATVHTDTAKFDLTLGLEETSAGLEGDLEYNVDLFDPTTAHRLLGHLGVLLEEIAAAPEIRLSACALLSPPERQQLLVEWLGDPEPRPAAATVHELFESRVERAPDRMAIVGDEQLSYRELNLRADRLARRLRALGVGAETVVALVVERGPEVVVGLLGILKAGGIYLPLDSSHPGERLTFLLRDASARVVLAQEAITGQLPGPEKHGARVVSLSGLPECELAQHPELPVDADQLAYVIYTSGTTGVPKGVAVSHRQVLPILCWSLRYFSLDEGTRVLQNLSHCFDFGVFELLTTLVAGGTLCFLPRGEQDDLGRALDAIARYRLNTVHTTPSFFRELLAQERPLPGLEIVHLGGEAVTPALVRRIEAAAGGCRIYNGYGPTETSINSTIFRLRRGRRATPVPIGRATARNTVQVVDRRGRPVPAGVAGELVIGGDGVARGYLHRPALTAERFVPDPTAADPGRRLYRSGDLVRRRGDGNIEFLGRIDQQVKLRGFRIELGEIEAVLGRQPAVQEAVVVVREDQPGRRLLVAYAVRTGTAADVDAGVLRVALRESLPDYMVPAVVTFLDALPRTVTGKVERQALPAPAAAPADSWVAPRGPLEEIVAGIWAEVLDRDRVGAHDDFFALGGHSLLATRVTSRLSRTLDVDLGPRQLFEHPTVAALAAALEKLTAAGAAAPKAPLVAVSRTAPPPLSFGQERMWFLHQLDPESIAYQAVLALGFEGALDPEALRRSFEEIVRRHEVLRTTFRVVGRQPVQVISPPAPFPMPLVDLAGLPAPARRTQRELLLLREAARPLDLTLGPLFRGVLLREGDREHVLLMRNHHIIFDGWSVAIMIRELAAFYRAFVSAAGALPVLPALPIQYADYASWQRRWLSGSEELRAQLAWWRERLEPMLPAARLAPDHPRSEGAPSRVRGLGFPVDATTAGGLRRLGRRCGATPFMTLMVAFQTLLHRHTRAPAVVVGAPIANRNRPEIEELIGFFINTLALGADFAGGEETSFRQLLEQVRETTLGAYAHQDLPLEKLVEVLQPDRQAAAQPLFQALFSFQNLPEPPLELPGVRVRTLPVEEESRGAMFELSLVMMEAGERFEGVLSYDAAGFEAATAARLLAHFRRLLEEIAVDPDRRVDELPLVAEGERLEIIGAATEAEVEVGAAGEGGSAISSEIAVIDSRRARLKSRQQRLSAAQQAHLAHRLRGRRRKAPPADAITPRPAEEPAPLSFAQERIWFLDQWVPGSPAYNVPCPLRLRSRLAAGALAASFDRIRHRHEVLRATFREVDGQPIMDIAPPASQPLPLVDLTALPGPRREDEARRLTVADGRRPFDLARGPVIRTTLLRLADEDHMLLLNVHHIAFDGWSLGVLIRELGQLYPALLAGRATTALPELPIGYSDFAWWQRRWLRGEVLDRQLAYWRRQLAGSPAALELPTDRPRPQRQRFRGWWHEIGIPSRFSEPLNALAQSAEATLFMALLAVLKILMWRITGQRDVVVGTLIAGRTRKEIEGLIGFFVNTLALRSDLGAASGGDPSFRQFLDHVRQVTMDAFAYQDLPFERVVEELQPRREPSRNPLFQVMCVLQNAPMERVELPELTLSAGPEAGGSARFDLTLAMVEDPSGVVGALEYSTDLFDHATIVRFAAQYQQLLGAIVEDPERPLSALPLLSAGERRQLLREAEAPSPLSEPAPSASRAAAERVLAGIWAEVLGVEQVGRDDDFFALGGRSMLAVRVIALARKAFAVPIPLQALFEVPTVAGLARWVEVSPLPPQGSKGKRR